MADTQNPLEELHARYLKAKDALGWTMERIAEESASKGVPLDKSEVTRFLNGKRIPTLPKFVTLCDLLGATTEERRAMEARIVALAAAGGDS